MKKNRKNYNTTIDADLMKQLKHLAVEREVKINDLLEEAITDLIIKHKTKPPKKPKDSK